MPTITLRNPSGLPQNGEQGLFRVTGGRITAQLFGELAAGVINVPNLTKLVFAPSGGNAVDLCLPVDINGDVVKTIYGITGNPNDELRRYIGALLLNAPMLYISGDIKVHCAGSPPGSNSFKWGLVWEKIDINANVVVL